MARQLRAMDVLVPGIGEIIGGSQREERLDVLKQKCADFNIPEDHVCGIWRPESLVGPALWFWHGF